jgi:hypothetical protein
MAVIEYKGHRIEVSPVGKGWREVIFAPGSTRALADLIGVGGVVVGRLLTTWSSWFLERRKEAAEKKRRRAQKFEELVAAVSEFDRWIDNFRDKVALGLEARQSPEVSPFAKIEAIALVYFPHLNARIAALNLEATKYRVWMIDAGQKRLSGMTEGVGEGFNQAYSAYSTAKEALLSDLRQFAQQEFQ